jgi:protocatechuate 3,4-dioxygenase beta subunit
VSPTPPILSSIEDPELRRTLLAREEGGELRFDVCLQGDGQTAFFQFAHFSRSASQHFSKNKT